MTLSLGSGDTHLIRGLWGHDVVSRERDTADNERKLLKGRSQEPTPAERRGGLSWESTVGIYRKGGAG